MSSPKPCKITSYVRTAAVTVQFPSSLFLQGWGLLSLCMLQIKAKTSWAKKPECEQGQNRILRGSGVDGMQAACPNPWVVLVTLWTFTSLEHSIHSPQLWPQWRHSSMWGRALTDFPSNSFRKQIYCPHYVPHKYCRFLGEAVYLYLPRIAFEPDIEPVSMQWLTLVVEQTKRSSLEWAGFKRK